MIFISILGATAAALLATASEAKAIVPEKPVSGVEGIAAPETDKNQPKKRKRGKKKK